MKYLARVIGIAVLFSLFGAMAPAYAQEERQEQQTKPEQQTKQKQQAQQKQEAKQSAQHAQQKHEAQQSAQHAQQKQEVKQSAQHAQQQERASQTQRASNDYHGSIPDARFRAHFGRDHGFRINRPVMVSGYPRFQYGGYWFGFIDPWPVGWYYTDQVYVDYMNGGYYLLSPIHPGVQISINVLL